MVYVNVKPVSIVFMALLALVNQFAIASILIEFDTPNIVAEEKDGKINGYYGLTLPSVNGIRPPVSCRFFFTLTFQSEHSPPLTIQTFSTDSSYENRDREEDLPGKLVIAGERWTIQMDEAPGGCLTAAGGGFRKDSAIPNLIESAPKLSDF